MDHEEWDHIWSIFLLDKRYLILMLMRILVKVILLFESFIKILKSTFPLLVLFDNGKSIHFPVILLMLFSNIPLKMFTMVLDSTFGAAVPYYPNRIICLFKMINSLVV